ncbi:hypothetical protein [Paenibacillus durus]|uniref:Uncharacterized protein n=1 Tax=Paenibacillus durus TaxID=44251 RepID=A0A089HTA1_PAEDU|nr:hypothetical protein [Paenibacillus durus]AIQ15266.1 hypothetical protein PDUR_27960 [Paenibacillus durus]
MGYGVPKEAAETTIRVPASLKDDLNGMKDLMRADTPHGVVRKLIDYRVKNEEEKVRLERQYKQDIARIEKEKNDLKAHQVKYMLDLGGNYGKQEFAKIKEELGLSTDLAVLTFLVECYRGIPQVPMGAFESYIRLKRAGE